MKFKMKKKHKIIVIIASILLIVFGIMIFKYNKALKNYADITKTFKTAFVTKDKVNMDKTSSVKINAKISEGQLIDNGTKKRKDLSGKITIDDKTYELKGSNLGNATNNVFWGEIKENSSRKYIFFMSDDLNSIYLDSRNEEAYIVAPANTIKEFFEVKNKLFGVG